MTINAREFAVIVRERDGSSVKNKTAEIAGYQIEGHLVRVSYARGGTYRYGRDRVHLAGRPRQLPPDPRTEILVDGLICDSSGGAYHFDTPDGGWWHIFSQAGALLACPTSEVEIIRNGAANPESAAVLHYWRELAGLLPAEGRLLREGLEKLTFLHPDSVLHRFLTGARVDQRKDEPEPRIYPFHTNLSQREAIDKALRFPISAVDGPPGTGKTQTILNLTANILLDESKTVAVVSSNNAAVENVREKLDDVGIGYVAANLGRSDKRREFLSAASQANRSSLVARLVATDGVEVGSAAEIATLDRRLRRLQATQGELAQRRTERDGYVLERQHFMTHFDRQSLPDPRLLPVLRWPADKILDYIADTDPELALPGALPEVLDRITHWIRYRSMRAVDASDVEVVLRLQQLYFDKKIADLDAEITRLAATLSSAKFDELTDQHRELSLLWLTDRLRRRYAQPRPSTYNHNYVREWKTFSRDYPVILSTCHSLQRSIGTGRMLDYLIIDEASQVNLLEAANVLACCKNVIVVGDLKQLAHIPGLEAKDCPPPPHPVYDFHRHSILSAFIELYGEALPRTMLREHYRCDPDIIGFCNSKFYNDELITFTTRVSGWESMIVARTVEGNHMRRHVAGSRSNQREIDVIEREILPKYCEGFAATGIGVTTPYRKQVSKVTDALVDAVEADTIHRFQGREKDVIVMTTVLDETSSDPDDKYGLGFLDDPQKVNVAVSRAKKRFVLVTNHDMLPSSSNLRDLIGYIGYRNPSSPVFDSSIVSVFDLLYRDYSARLRPLISRIRRRSRFLSQDIIATVLEELVQEENYLGLGIRAEVLVRNLLPDTTKLTAAGARYVNNRASFDFVVFNRVTRRWVCAIEVDGFEYHENDPVQLARDALKNRICVKYRIPLLRLPTTGSAEIPRIRAALDRVLTPGFNTGGLL
ncbi:AAA domain-containing protein [Nocardia sp. NPDC058633]|uniref:AAA domain-containing protein n=1 Tax=Nocardia sp. NPDC058633 TaxID=3346568 RepID=UPI0036549C92